jgi:protein Tex
VVKPGDIVKVKVLEVDLKRKRISLTMRLSDDAASQTAERGMKKDRPLSPRDRQHMTDKPKGKGGKGRGSQGGRSQGGGSKSGAAPDNAMAAAFGKAGLTKRK